MTRAERCAALRETVAAVRAQNARPHSPAVVWVRVEIATLCNLLTAGLHDVTTCRRR